MDGIVLFQTRARSGKFTIPSNAATTVKLNYGMSKQIIIKCFNVCVCATLNTGNTCVLNVILSNLHSSLYFMRCDASFFQQILTAQSEIYSNMDDADADDNYSEELPLTNGVISHDAEESIEINQVV